MFNNEVAETEIRKKGIRKIILGAGTQKKDGYLTADQEQHYKPDLVIDLNEKWFLPCDWFTHILAENIVEHIRDVPAFINACHDRLQDGGELTIIVPYWAGRWATGDPTHIHFFNQDSFNGWTVWAGLYIHLNHQRRFRQTVMSFQMEDDQTGDEQIIPLGFCRILGMTFVLKKIPWKDAK